MVANKEAFVNLNGQQVFYVHSSNNVPERGVNTLRIDPVACIVTEENHYDTYADPNAATRLKTYLEGLSDNSLLVVVTCDEPSRLLSAAESTLQAFGADVTDVQFRGSFTFVAKKGEPAMTILDKVLTEADSQTMQAFVDAIVQGRTLNSDAIYCLFTDLTTDIFLLFTTRS